MNVDDQYSCVAPAESDDLARTRPAGEQIWKHGAAHIVHPRDEKKIKSVKEDIDTLLAFAGLIAAVPTAFIIESYKQPQSDPAVATVYPMTKIATQLNSSLVNQQTDESIQVTSSSAFISLHIIGIWYSSLVISLITASLGILVKQWLREYLAIDNRPWQFFYRHRGLALYHVFDISAFLPVLLQIASALFLSGLILFLHELNPLIGWLITGVVAGWLMLSFVTIVAALADRLCPYKAPMQLHLLPLLQRFLSAFSTDPIMADELVRQTARTIRARPRVWTSFAQTYHNARRRSFFWSLYITLRLRRYFKSDPVSGGLNPSVFAQVHRDVSNPRFDLDACWSELIADKICELKSTRRFERYMSCAGDINCFTPESRPKIRRAIVRHSVRRWNSVSWQMFLALSPHDVPALGDIIQDLLCLVVNGQPIGLRLLYRGFATSLFLVQYSTRIQCTIDEQVLRHSCEYFLQHPTEEGSHTFPANLTTFSFLLAHSTSNAVQENHHLIKQSLYRAASGISNVGLSSGQTSDQWNRLRRLVAACLPLLEQVVSEHPELELDSHIDNLRTQTRGRTSREVQTPERPLDDLRVNCTLHPSPSSSFPASVLLPLHSD
ncbi:hypothetical protein K474DRAFT_1631424 [Panus rudis PR-1116 ss-1]|nr:hypothetical protein K474DRAFT_1631424 [Panus rudis PR-1116 ss-1]